MRVRILGIPGLTVTNASHRSRWARTLVMSWPEHLRSPPQAWISAGHAVCADAI